MAVHRKTARDEIPAWLERTYDASPKARRAAIHALCPCTTKVHDPRVWRRMIAMAGDPDAGVRAAICHVLCDGSPAEYQGEIVACLETLRLDDERKVRKMARGVLTAYRHTGRLNVL